VPWLREYLHYDPPALAASIRCPMLILYGSADFQMKPEADGPPLANAARAAGTDVTLETFPDLDHLFKPVPAGQSTPAKYYEKDRHVDARLLDRLTAWITQHARRPS